MPLPHSEAGQEYWAAMNLMGDYASATDAEMREKDAQHSERFRANRNRIDRVMLGIRSNKEYSIDKAPNLDPVDPNAVQALQLCLECIASPTTPKEKNGPVCSG
ncbi:MAG TPA: hypothetical protein VE988_23115 [Gemmataceae bacterium]|nr:hypothetical protein [Gemmataceae bacterium]